MDDTFFDFKIPEDVSDHSEYPAIHCTIDEDGDLHITDGEGQLLLSYPQAYALVLSVQQNLIKHDRVEGYRPRRSLKVVP